MHVLNVHERSLPVGPDEAGSLLDSLSSREDALWPKAIWPPLVMDRPLGVGASGGHGPVRYAVAAYFPGQRVTFRFTAPAGFDGFHRFEIVAAGEGRCILRHTLEMKATGAALLSWPLVFRPLHDALLEDCLALAQATLGQAPDVRPWSGWVRLLRWILSGGRRRSQLPLRPGHVRGIA